MIRKEGWREKERETEAKRKKTRRRQEEEEGKKGPPPLSLLLLYSRVRSSPALRATSSRFASRRETVSVFLFCFEFFCCCFPQKSFLREGSRGFSSSSSSRKSMRRRALNFSLLQKNSLSLWSSLFLSRCSFLLVLQAAQSPPPAHASSKQASASGPPEKIVANRTKLPRSAAILRPCSNRAASARFPAADAHSQTRASALASCEVSSPRLILSAEEVMACCLKSCC